MSWHLDEFNIERFRGLQNVRLTGLGRINLLVGLNDSGKTSILEALSVFANPLDPFNFITLALSRVRGEAPFFQPLPESLRWLFPQEAKAENDKGDKAQIRFSASGSYELGELSAEYRSVLGLRRNLRDAAVDLQEPEIDQPAPGFDRSLLQRGGEVTLKLKFHPAQNSKAIKKAIKEDPVSFLIWEDNGFRGNPIVPTVSLPSELLTVYSHRNSLSDRFSDARRQGIEGSVIDLMRQIDSQISDIEILSGGFDRAVLHIKHDLSGLVPISMFGDGIRRALAIALTIPGVEHGILLIDEIDAAIHTSALTNLFEWIINACRQFDVQLFATTHSLEAVDALIQAARRSDELVLFRLPPMGNDIAALRLDQRKLRMVRAELGQEVRQWRVGTPSSVSRGLMTRPSYPRR